MKIRNRMWDVDLDESEQVDLPASWVRGRTYRVVGARVQQHHESGSVHVSLNGYVVTKSGERHASSSERPVMVDAPELTKSIVQYLGLGAS